MLFENAAPPARIMLWGDVLLIACCAFYLLWWHRAFKPAGAAKGFASGWLLIPAAILGLAAVVMIIRGARGAAGSDRALFSSGALFAAAAALYAVLLVVTRFAFRRQVTSELFLIVGWAALAFLEVNALFALGMITRGGAVALLAAALVAAAAGIVCYVLYYRLSPRAAYVDGMVPLVLVALYTVLLLAQA